MVDFSCHQREPLKLHARCRTCSRIYMRGWQADHKERVSEYQREYRERNLEASRKRGREYQRRRRADPETAPIVKEQMHRSWQKMRDDPVRWAERLESQRINYRLKAEREGRSVRQIREKTYAEGNGKVPVHGYVNAAELAPLILEWLGEFHSHPLGGHEWNGQEVSGAGYVQLAEISGVSDRTLREIVQGNRTSTQYATADAICAAIDMPIAAVYPNGAGKRR